jgi:transcriptional regulator GlxA family with amidase domain
VLFRSALVLVTRFINVADEVATLNDSLENFIVENALLNEKLEKLLKKKPEAAMSTIAEEKIKNVIKYINENYLTEITREDLAGSVGVHPDSLGKQFKKYTGYKLGDYINELRVNEAARRLREEDTNIIDIAFDVGFESVRTFNRIFPKFMNETPNNYRKIFQGGIMDGE